MNVNKAILIGRITSDLQLKTTPTGRTVLSFGIATNRNWKDQSGVKQEKTDFHNVVVWGKQAEVIAQYCMKGQELYVEGRMETRNWDDEQSGKKMYRTEVVLERFEFGQRPGGAPAPSGAAPAAAAPAAASAAAPAAAAAPEPEIRYPDEEIDPEDIPF